MGFTMGSPPGSKGPGSMLGVCSLSPWKPEQEKTGFKAGRERVTLSQGWDISGSCQGGWGKARQSLPFDIPPPTPHPAPATPLCKALPTRARALSLWQLPKLSIKKEMPIVQYRKEMPSFCVTKPNQTARSPGVSPLCVGGPWDFLALSGRLPAIDF